MTPLQHAAFKGKMSLCEQLLANGADININKHENGYTTLMFGALSGKFEPDTQRKVALPLAEWHFRLKRKNIYNCKLSLIYLYLSKATIVWSLL